MRRSSEQTLDRVTADLEARHVRCTPIDPTTVAVTTDPTAGSYEYSLLISLEGEQRNILCVRAEATTPVPRDDWPVTLAHLNTWNCRFRQPKTVLNFHPSKPEGRLWAITELFKACVATDEALEDFTSRALYSTARFFTWAHQTLPGPPARR